MAANKTAGKVTEAARKTPARPAAKAPAARPKAAGGGANKAAPKK